MIQSIPISISFSSMLESVKLFGRINTPGSGSALAAKFPIILPVPIASSGGMTNTGIFFPSSNWYYLFFEPFDKIDVQMMRADILPSILRTGVKKVSK